MTASEGVTVHLADGDAILRLDFNALDVIQEHLGMGMTEFFAEMGKGDAKVAAQFLETTFLRKVFYAGLLWTVPHGEVPSFDEIAVGRRMELSRLAEYGEAAMSLFLKAFGLTDSQSVTKDALQGNRKTRRKATSKKGKARNPTRRLNT